MKVLYLLRYYPTLTETFVHDEVTEVARRGVVVAIASLGERADGRLALHLPRVPVLRVPRRSVRARLGLGGASTGGGTWLGHHQRPRDVARLPWLAHRAAAFDRVHVHFAGEAAEWAHALRVDLGLPYTVTVHAADLFRPRPSLREVLGAAERVFTVSRYNVEMLAKLGVSAELLRCGPRLEGWRMPPPPGGPLRALAVARDVPKKGLSTLEQAWRQGLAGTDARLTVVSDRRPADIDGVEYTGLLPRAGVWERLAASNLVVLPCRQAGDGDMDGVPLVLMEALAAGRAVVTTPISGIPELVDEAVGWLVSPDDPDALARALLSTTPGELRRLGAAGPERLARRGFCLQSQVDELLWQWSRGTGG